MNEFNHDQELNNAEQTKVKGVFDKLNANQDIDETKVAEVDKAFKEIKSEMLKLGQGSELHFNQSFKGWINSNNNLKNILNEASNYLSSKGENFNIHEKGLQEMGVLQKLMTKCSNDLIFNKTNQNKDLVDNSLFSSIVNKIQHTSGVDGKYGLNTMSRLGLILSALRVLPAGQDDDIKQRALNLQTFDGKITEEIVKIILDYCEKSKEIKGPMNHNVVGGPAGLTVDSDFAITYKKRGNKIISSNFTKPIEYKKDSIKINNTPINQNEYNIKNFDAATGLFTLEKKTDGGPATVSIQAPNVKITTPGAKIENRSFTTTNMTPTDIISKNNPNNFEGKKTETTEKTEIISLEMKSYKNKQGEKKQLLYSPQALSQKTKDAINNNSATENTTIVGPDTDIKTSLDRFTGNKPSTMLKIEELTTDANGKVINFKPGVEGSGTTDIGPYLAFIPDPAQKEAMKALYNTPTGTRMFGGEKFQNKKMSFEIENGKVVGLDLNTLPADDSILNAFTSPKLKRVNVQNYAPNNNTNITSIVENNTSLNGKNVGVDSQGKLTYSTKKNNPFLLSTGTVVNGDRKADGVK